MIPSVQLEISRQYSNGHTLYFSAYSRIFSLVISCSRCKMSKTASFTRSKCPFAYGHASGLHSQFSSGQSFSFAVIVTEVKISPFPRRIRSASSATVLVTVFAVR